MTLSDEEVARYISALQLDIHNIWQLQDALWAVVGALFASTTYLLYKSFQR